MDDLVTFYKFESLICWFKFILKKQQEHKRVLNTAEEAGCTGMRLSFQDWESNR